MHFAFDEKAHSIVRFVSEGSLSTRSMKGECHFNAPYESIGNFRSTSKLLRSEKCSIRYSCTTGKHLLSCQSSKSLSMGV